MTTSAVRRAADRAADPAADRPADRPAVAPAEEDARARFHRVAAQLLDEDPRIALVLADIGADRFARSARAHPDRVLNVGIREQLLVGVGSGLALAGMRPIVHTFGSFLIERPFEQVKLDLNHQGVGAVLVSALGSYDWPAGGRTHMSPGDVALLDTLPDWTVHVPGHPDEAESLLRDAVAGEGLVYLRLSAQSNSAARPVTPGRFLTVRQGGSASRAVVIAVGPMLDNVLAATDNLDVTVLYAATVRPFDGAALRAAAGRAVGSDVSAGSGSGARDVVLVEPYLAGTSVPFAAEALADRPHRLLGLGVPRAELRHYGTMAEHIEAYGLDPASLRARMSAWL